jgi:hypothetical protein
MTVYVRTEEGQLAAYSPDSALPRKLRSLLKVIDGKTPIEVYATSLKAFGDVRGVLKSLDMAGLITPMSQLPVGQLQRSEADSSAGQSSVSWIHTKPQGVLAAHQEDSGPRTQAAFMPTRSAQAGTDIASQVARTHALARAIDAMSTFVLAHAPEHSFVVLKELEQLDSLEQLAVTLGGYEQLINHIGAPAQQHLYSVKQMLREHL